MKSKQSLKVLQQKNLLQGNFFIQEKFFKSSWACSSIRKSTNKLELPDMIKNCVYNYL
jgi:hypothetical protein